MPSDFFDVIQYRLYLDSVEELLSYYDYLNEPLDYVKFTPKLFHEWSNWARTYKVSEQDQIRPLGVHIGPNWMITEFKDLDDFYKFYREITGDLDE